ncbi:MAG: hypothetical protein LAO05_07145 [Acidobacteriia bacterium]|nr:hypothetical protein [Terriglobia bacterium]
MGIRWRDLAGRHWWLGATLLPTVMLQLVLTNVWPRFQSPNERARAYQAIAVVTRGSLEISPELDRFGDMEDVAAVAGRRFPNKAPGTLPLVVPGALFAHVFASDSHAVLGWTLVLGRLLAASFPFALTVLLIARATVAKYPRGGPFATVTYALATPALASSLLLFSHALTACLLVGAFLLLFERERPVTHAGALAGLLLAWASACEYSAALPAAVVVLAAARRLRLRGLLAASAAAALPLALLAAYNTACFGSPLSLSSAHETYGTFATLVRHGIFGISLPTLSGLGGLLLSPARGLFVWAPLAAFAILGACVNASWPSSAGGRVALWAAPLALLLAMSGYPNWHGGWFPGPRYLLQVLPFIFLLVAPSAELVLADAWGRMLAGLGALWGWAAVWPCLASFPFPPEDVPLPALTLAPGLLADGIHAPSWLPGALVLPALAALALAACSVLLTVGVAQRHWYERPVAVVGLVVALLAAGRIQYPATWQASLERAVIHDVYADGPPGALEALVACADSRSRRVQVETWIARRAKAPVAE